MVRSAAERYVVGAFAFMAAATWLGIGLIHGFLCLFVAVLASLATRIYQRRSGSSARASRRRAPAARRRPPAERPSRAGLYDSDREDWNWPTASDAAW